MPIIEGSGLGAPLTAANVATFSTDEIQTLTIGGTPTGGSFTLSFQGFTTAAITWNATNATLIAAIDAALEALPTIGAGGVATAAGTLTAGIGTVTLTFGGNLAGMPLAAITVANNSLTGTSPTLAVARTTPGVAASGRGAPRGALMLDTAGGGVYVNDGTALKPNWNQR